MVWITKLTFTIIQSQNEYILYLENKLEAEEPIACMLFISAKKKWTKNEPFFPNRELRKIRDRQEMNRLRIPRRRGSGMRGGRRWQGKNLVWVVIMGTCCGALAFNYWRAGGVVRCEWLANRLWMWFKVVLGFLGGLVVFSGCL